MLLGWTITHSRSGRPAMTKKNVVAGEKKNNKRKEQQPLAHGPSVKEEKRRKWQAKQERNNRREEGEDDTAAVARWCQEHSNFATLVTEQDIADLRNRKDRKSADSALEDSNDKRLDNFATHLHPYWNIQEATIIGSNSTDIVETVSVNESTGASQRLFIAEGTETIRLLLQQRQQQQQQTHQLDPALDKIQIQSIFVKPSVLLENPVRLVDNVQALFNENGGERGDDDDNQNMTATEPTTPGFHVLVARSEDVLGQVAGFPVKRGALACGICPTDRTEAWLDTYLSTLSQQQQQQHMLPSSSSTAEKEELHLPSRTLRILALDGICDTANLGSMIRTASVLGVHVVVLSHHTCDAWYRRTIRVSMGHVFLVPIVRVANLAAFLRKWGCPNTKSSSDSSISSSGDRFCLTSYAAVVQKDQDTLTLGRMPPQSSVTSSTTAWCCVMGNEGNGISKDVLAACTQRLRIDMAEGVDSLSVPIAAGILLHGLREREQKS